MSVEFPSFWRIWEESFPLHIQVFRGCLCSSSHMPSFCMCVSVYSVLSDSLLPQRGSLTVACQASLSMGFSRQEYWSGLPFPSLGDLSDPGIETRSPCIDRWILYHWATREAQWVVLEDSKSFHLGNHHTHVICLAVEAVLDSRFSSLSGNLSNYSKQHRGTEESGDSLVSIWIKNQQTADADCYT